MLFPSSAQTGIRFRAPVLLNGQWPQAFLNRVGESICVQVSPESGCYEFSDADGQVFWIEYPFAPLTNNWPVLFLRPGSVSDESNILLAPWRLADIWPLAGEAQEIPLTSSDSLSRETLTSASYSSTLAESGSIPSVTSLCFRAFTLSPTNFCFTAAWPSGEGLPSATLDLYSTDSLSSATWQLIFSISNAVSTPFSFTVSPGIIPGWSNLAAHVHDSTCTASTNVILSPLDGVTPYTNIVYGCNVPAPSPKSAFFKLGTRLDTDEDGLSDAFELLVSHTSETNADTDGDGLSDSDELTLGTNPLSSDSDGDGIPDAAELANATDPMNPDTIPPQFLTSPVPVPEEGVWVP